MGADRKQCFFSSHRRNLCFWSKIGTTCSTSAAWLLRLQLLCLVLGFQRLQVDYTMPVAWCLRVLPLHAQRVARRLHRLQALELASFWMFSGCSIAAFPVVTRLHIPLIVSKLVFLRPQVPCNLYNQPCCEILVGSPAVVRLHMLEPGAFGSFKAAICAFLIVVRLHML